MKETSPLKNAIIGVAAFFLLFYFVGRMRNRQFDKYGVYTFCRVIKLEGSGDGAALTVEVFYKKARYLSVLNDICMSCVGDYFYCKIIPGNRKDMILYKELPVPHCMIQTLLEKSDGWNTIPKDTCQLEDL